LPVGKPLNKITKGNSSNNIYVTLGSNVYTINTNDLNSPNGWKKVLEVPNQITSIAFKTYQNEDYLLLGDLTGHIYLVNANSGEIILDKKVHQSSVSNCNLDIVKDDLLLISSGLDHKVVVDYLFKNEKESFLSKSTVDFDLHTAWVTDMAYDANTGTYYTCSEDMNIRKWFFDPNEIYKISQIFLKDKSK
jgi:WD40 repeat protein